MSDVDVRFVGFGRGEMDDELMGNFEWFVCLSYKEII